MLNVLFYVSLVYSLYVEIEATIPLNASECALLTMDSKCPNSNVTFWLYNTLVQDYQMDETNLSSFTKASLVNNTTVLLLHGYTESKSLEPNNWVRKPYIELGYNVISADYSKLVPNPCYLQAYDFSDRIADCVANFIDILISNTKVTFKTFEVVGFSLGGQIGGRVGTYLKKRNHTLNRLVGIDVAGPLYWGLSTYIDKSSANFVMLIHTNNLFGNAECVGHVDFIVNSGILQPGCEKTLDLMAANKCSHLRGPEYFAETIKSNSTKVFCGRSTEIFGNKSIIMGETTPSSARGIYRVTTNLTSPYAMDTAC